VYENYRGQSVAKQNYGTDITFLLFAGFAGTTTDAINPLYCQMTSENHPATAYGRYLPLALNLTHLLKVNKKAYKNNAVSIKNASYISSLSRLTCRYFYQNKRIFLFITKSFCFYFVVQQDNAIYM